MKAILASAILLMGASDAFAQVIPFSEQEQEVIQQERVWKELQRRLDEQARAMKEAERDQGKTQLEQEAEQSRRVLQELQDQQHQPRRK
jgi:hypothetical protein